MTKRICVILPALNEESTIGLVIEEIPRAELEKKGYQTDIVVVNNGSTDKTAEIAAASGAHVIEEPRRGKGMALRAGFEAASCDFVFMLDSDYTYPAVHIPAMLEMLESGYDVVMGSRLKGTIMDGAMSSLNRIGNHLLALMTNILYGTKISDPCTGCWGLRAGVLKGLKLEAKGFEDRQDPRQAPVSLRITGFIHYHAHLRCCLRPQPRQAPGPFGGGRKPVAADPP